MLYSNPLLQCDAIGKTLSWNAVHQPIRGVSLNVPTWHKWRIIQDRRVRYWYLEESTFSTSFLAFLHHTDVENAHPIWFYIIVNIFYIIYDVEFDMGDVENVQLDRIFVYIICNIYMVYTYYVCKYVFYWWCEKWYDDVENTCWWCRKYSIPGRRWCRKYFLHG